MLTEKFYAGIGSREVNDSVGTNIRYIAEVLEHNRYTLRTGGAEGCDQYAQSGVEHSAQIWLPWATYNKGIREEYPDHKYMILSEGDKEAWESVEKFHPNPTALSRGARALHARNYRILVGKTYPNSEFVVCWTRDGKDSGGSGQLIRTANFLKIPVYNLFNMSREAVLEAIEKNHF